jgi:hypothetical protein
MFVYCMLSGRGLCDELITRPEGPTDSGASLCVITKPHETRRPYPALGCRARENNNKKSTYEKYTAVRCPVKISVVKSEDGHSGIDCRLDCDSAFIVHVPQTLSVVKLSVILIGAILLCYSLFNKLVCSV